MCFCYEYTGNIRVFCRCRPLNKVEMSSGCTTVVDFDAAKDGCLGILATGSSKKSFRFDRVYTPKDDQGMRRMWYKNSVCLTIINHYCHISSRFILLSLLVTNPHGYGEWFNLIIDWAKWLRIFKKSCLTCKTIIVFNRSWHCDLLIVIAKETIVGNCFPWQKKKEKKKPSI